MILFFFLLSIVLAEPLTGAELVQKTIPQLEGDISAERATIAARERYFNGEEQYYNAFLKLQNAPLLSPSFLRSRYVAVD